MVRVVTLQATHKRHGHGSGEKGIFSVGFFAASPTRVSRQIGVRSANDNALAAMSRARTVPGASDLIFALKNVTRFVAFDRRCLLQQVRIPSLTQANRLRKLRGWVRLEAAPLPSARTSIGHTVQSLNVAGAVDAQPRNIRRGAERTDLFFRRHQREDVIDTSFNRQARILKRISIRLRRSEAHRQRDDRGPHAAQIHFLSPAIYRRQSRPRRAAVR